jgi:hypothetical protein
MLNMGKYCLIKSLSEEFRKRLKSGEIDPEKLSGMTSQERRDYFGSFLGDDNAKNVNALFEKNLLRKNKMDAMVKWAKEVTGIRPEVKRDLITKLEKMQSDPNALLDPKTEQAFLQDLASAKIGTDVTLEEATAISQMTKDMMGAKSAMEKGGDRLEYGASRVILENYMADLTLKNKEALPKSIGERMIDLAGAAKGIKSSLDVSAFARQGWKTLWTHPTVWAENVAKTLGDVPKSFKGADVVSAIKADIFSREHALNGTYKKMKLDIGSLEEAYPSTIPEKIPVFKALYKASEDAYKGFLMRVRADLADNLLAKAKSQGIDITDEKQVQSLGKLINSMTGRGDLGKAELVSKELNVAFFSIKFLKSNIDFLTAHQLQKGVTPFVRKEAATNLLKVVAGTAGTLATINAFMPGSVDFDPRSSRFGKVKIGDTTFDFSAGMGSIVSLASRLVTQQTKNSNGVLTDLNSGFGSQTGFDLFTQFWEGKLSPASGLVRDLMAQKDFNGNPLTVQGELVNLFVPLPISNAVELYQDPNAAPVLLGVIADGLGIGTNTNSPSTTDWNNSEGKELGQFKEKVGQAKFDQANKEYNESLASKILKLTGTDAYKGLSDKDKKAVITRLKDQEKEGIFKKYHFQYKQEKSTTQTKSLDSMIRSLKQ